VDSPTIDAGSRDRSHGDPKNPPPAIDSVSSGFGSDRQATLCLTKRHWVEAAFSVETDSRRELTQNERACLKTVVIGGDETTNYGVDVQPPGPLRVWDLALCSFEGSDDHVSAEEAASVRVREDISHAGARSKGLRVMKPLLEVLTRATRPSRGR